MSDETIASDVEAAPSKGTPEYNELMAQKYDHQTAGGTNDQTFEQPAEISTIPEGGLDKFYNKETGDYDWPNHVRELDYRLSNNETPAEAPTDSPVDESTGLDWDSITQDVSTNNALSDGHRTKLNSAGIPDDVINSYLDLLNIGQEYTQQRTIEYAGGEENINGLFDWASTNLSEEEVSNYNEILDSPNWRMAIDSLQVASGIGGVDAPQDSTGPQLVEGENSTNSGTTFSSKQQMIDAMSDPRYKSDPAFRNQVRLRVGRSNF